MPLHGHEPRLSRGSAPLTTFPLAQPQIHVFFTKILYTNTGALLTILKYKFSIKRRFSMWNFVMISFFIDVFFRQSPLFKMTAIVWIRHLVNSCSIRDFVMTFLFQQIFLRHSFILISGHCGSAYRDSTKWKMIDNRKPISSNFGDPADWCYFSKAYFVHRNTLKVRYGLFSQIQFLSLIFQ